MMHRHAAGGALFWALALGGCTTEVVIDPGPDPIFIYDRCGTVAQCEAAADFCGEVEGQWPSGSTFGNICTNSCQTDDDCFTSANGEIGGCYAFLSDTATPVCLERCDFDTDCPSGFVCQDSTEEPDLAPGDAVCVPAPSGGSTLTPVYDLCVDVNDCELAADLCGSVEGQWVDGNTVDNVCTNFCTTDDDCFVSNNGEVGGCYDFLNDLADPVCLERCFVDGDCPNGFVCQNWYDESDLDLGDSVCVPEPPFSLTPVYDPCTDVSQCRDGVEACALVDGFVTQNNFCTNFCVNDSDCPFGPTEERGGCYALATDIIDPICLQRCLDDFDCPTGFSCYDSIDEPALDPGDSVCFPD